MIKEITMDTVEDKTLYKRKHKSQIHIQTFISGTGNTNFKNSEENIAQVDAHGTSYQLSHVTLSQSFKSLDVIICAIASVIFDYECSLHSSGGVLSCLRMALPVQGTSI